MPATLPPDPSPTHMPKLHAALIAGASILIPAILLVRLFLNFRHQYFLNHVEGVWLACAHDFVNGVLYRPLFGPLGYGGTRYFPLYFVLTGTFSRVFGTLEASGLVLAAISILLLCVAAYTLLRTWNVSLLLRIGAVAGILAASTTQQLFLSTKGDSLAAMLNLWGLALCLRPRVSRAIPYLAAIFFTLAFAAKLTTVFGVGAVLLGWTLARR
jgi:hypothetical protein